MKLDPTTYEGLSLETVLAFDVETTGLDASQDEILEIGMVRMENGELCQRLEQLCKPSVPIPDFVTQLTGIRQADCENQPVVNEIIPDVAEFLKEGWILAHNASFDFGFLAAAYRRYDPDLAPVSPSRILDTLELSRLLLPWLPNHQLGTIAQFLEIPVIPTHRALADAEATILIFRSMIPLVLALNPQTIESILNILSGASDGLRLFFQHVADFIKSIPAGKTKKYLKGPANVLGNAYQESPGQSDMSFDLKKIDAFFAPGGDLSGLLPGYESRTPQREMAHTIGSAFQRDEVLVAEAGTGIGKSLAYLVPAILWATHEKGDKTVISTQTKTLQDQLFSKELPVLLETLNRSFFAVLLKGKANYLCKRRWMDVLHQINERMVPSKRRKLLSLLVWIEETRTGDIEENAGFKRGQIGDLWSEINCDPGHCMGSRCEFEHGCFYQHVRRASRKADLVLVNHSLLFSDLASDHSVLGEYESLIVDEAHQVERTASRCLGKTLQRSFFRKLCHRLYKAGSYESGLLVQLTQELEKIKKPGRDVAELLASLPALTDSVQDLREKSDDLFRGMEERINEQLKVPGANWKVRIRKPEDFFGLLSKETEALLQAMQVLISRLSRMAEVLLEQEGLDDILSEESRRDLEYVILHADGLRSVLENISHGEYENEVVWSEMAGYHNEQYVVLSSAPLHIGSILAEKLYPRLKRALMTSATLTVGKQFDYILGRLGLDQLEHDRVMTRAFGSPFDFQEQALFMIPAYMSSPKTNTFTREVALLLEHVLSIHSRGTMVLFTSHQMLREVYRNLQPVLANTGIRLLGQGIDGSRSSLLKIFQEEEQSVLLGTNSFWEGVDVPGSALELLVITRIPFDVPTEPWIEANMEDIEQTVGNGFMRYSVPEAVVRFRQGFGRLIRSREDRGVVLFLDNRSVHTRYGSLFLRSLPVEAHICDNEESVLHGLEQWFQSVSV
jgi:ATP-dependent DNA helicase DinG